MKYFNYSASSSDKMPSDMSWPNPGGRPCCSLPVSSSETCIVITCKGPLWTKEIWIIQKVSSWDFTVTSKTHSGWWVFNKPTDATQSFIAGTAVLWLARELMSKVRWQVSKSSNLPFLKSCNSHLCICYLYNMNGKGYRKTIPWSNSQVQACF